MEILQYGQNKRGVDAPVGGKVGGRLPFARRPGPGFANRLWKPLELVSESPAGGASRPPFAATRRSGPVGWMCLVAMLIAAPGCDLFEGRQPQSAGAKLPALSALSVNDGEDKHAVVARGRLEPTGGVIAILAPAGNRLLRLDVKEGDPVEKGMLLGELDGLQARRIERALAEDQLAEAKAQFGAKQRVAEANLEVARVGLAQARQLLAHAESELERARQADGRLGLLRKEVRMAQDKLNRLRDANRDPSTPNLVSRSTLNDHQLLVDQSQADLSAAEQEASKKIESARLGVQLAEKEFEAAEVAIETAKSSASFRSLERRLELIDLQVKATKLVSPINGCVVSVSAKVGEATVGAPLLHVADTKQMECHTEINVADLHRIRPGAEAKISSPAFPDRVLTGTVKTISQIVGAPRLPAGNPLAPADWRSAEVVIRINHEDCEVAAGLIHLQVDVALRAEPVVETEEPMTQAFSRSAEPESTTPAEPESTTPAEPESTTPAEPESTTPAEVESEAAESDQDQPASTADALDPPVAEAGER